MAAIKHIAPLKCDRFQNIGFKGMALLYVSISSSLAPHLEVKNFISHLKVTDVHRPVCGHTSNKDFIVP